MRDSKVNSRFFPVIDLNETHGLGHSPVILQGTMADELWQNHLLASDRISANAHLSQVRGAVQWQPEGSNLHLFGSVPLYGLCATHLSRKSTRHRSLSSSPTIQAIPHGYSRPGVSKHIGRCQRKQRLANLCRFCPIPDSHRQEAVPERRVRRRPSANGVRPRLHYHRLMTVGISLGQIPQNQKRGKAPHPIGSTRKHSNIHQDQRRQTARCQHPRRDHPGTRFFLYDGPGVRGFCPSVLADPIRSFLRYSCKIQPPIPKALFQASGQIQRFAMRSNHRTDNPSIRKRLSGSPAADKIFRRRKQQNPGIPDQRFHPTSTDNCPTVSVSLAGGTVLQMDQAAPAHQIIFRNVRKRSQDSNLDCHLRLRARGHHQKTAQTEGKPLHNSTDFKRLHFRENAVSSNGYKSWRGCFSIQPSQPVEIVRLITGH